MPMNNPFDNAAFRIVELTNAINRLPHYPRQVTASGIFMESGMSTTSALIELRDGVLAMVKDTARGAPSEIQARNNRSIKPFMAAHLPRTRRLLADEVSGVRAFGSETATEEVQPKRDEYLLDMRRAIDVTLEYHKIGAVKGIVMDADGTTPLLNLFTEFGFSQQTQAMGLGTAGTEVRALVGTVMRMVEDALKGEVFDRAFAWCGTGFWDALIVHPKVKEAYLSTAKANEVVGSNPLDTFDFAGTTWSRYRGAVGGVPFVASGEAYFVPGGVANMFVTKYAPADYLETVNRTGLPYYSKSWVEDNSNKAMVLEAQSNPLTLNTRPDAVIKLTL